MNKLLTALLLASVATAPAMARPSSSSSFSRSYSRPSSSFSYSASRSSSSFSRPSYSAPRSYSSSRSYSAASTYSSTHTTVVHNHSSSGGGFGSSFLGGMMGSMVGNSLSQPHGYVSGGGSYNAAPQQDYSDYSAPVTEVSYVNHSAIWPWVVFPLLGIGVATFLFMNRKKSVYSKPRKGIFRSVISHVALYKGNPGLIPGVIVNIPESLGVDDGKHTFVMDNVGKQPATAIGKNDAYAHLYFGDGLDEDFVRVFVSSNEGGKPREAWVFSNVDNRYGDYVSLWNPTVNLDGKVWVSNLPSTMSGTETIIDKDGNETDRSYTERLYRSGDEYMLIRNLSDSESRAQRLYAGVSIPVSSIA